MLASRSSGPGGQNVNKVSTRIELRLPMAAILGLPPEQFARLRSLLGRRLSAAGEIRLVAQQSRSQEMNRRAALEQLAALIEEATHLPKPRRKTRPTRGGIRRRLENKRHASDIKRQRHQQDE
jgi:ribosome-associated protein